MLFRRKHPIPFPRRIRRHRFAAWLCCATMVLLLLVALNTFRVHLKTNSRLAAMGIPPRYVLMPLALGVAGFALTIYPFQMWRQFRAAAAIKRRARETNYALCTNCGHDLTGLGDSGICPECGRPFTLAALKREWTEVGA